MATRVELKKITVVGENPAPFKDPIVLRVAFEVFELPPSAPIDVKFTWSPIWDFPVDQTLDELEVGPLLATGKHEFVVETDPPDFSTIPDPTGPTALLISFSYKGSEFLHIGYNVVVTCEGEIPDVFTSCDMLRRRLDRCYPRLTEIAWDNAAPPQGGDDSDDDKDAREKRSRHED